MVSVLQVFFGSPAKKHFPGQFWGRSWALLRTVLGVLERALEVFFGRAPKKHFPGQFEINEPKQKMDFAYQTHKYQQAIIQKHVSNQ